MFTLRTRMQRSQVSHPIDALEPQVPVDENIEVEVVAEPAPGLCSDKPEAGIHTVRGRFGRCHTHNEQTFVRPCGIIRGRETFYGSETIPQVVVSVLFNQCTYAYTDNCLQDMVYKKHLIPGSMPRCICYDNNCGLYKWCAAREHEGERLHLDVGLPVDVFHWKCKHAKTDIECSYHCNPHMFPDLIGPDGASWYFNSSACEQTNGWFGGYHAIVREMSAVKYDFFLDEMILRKNELTRAKLEQKGYLPGYNDTLRFSTSDVSS